MSEFADWIATTALSGSLRDALWAIPALQSVHIIAIAAVVSSVLFINLRLLNIADRSQSLFATADRFLPWIWFGLVVLALTGSLLIIAEPRRELLSVPFWIKMGLVCVGIAITAGFQGTLQTHRQTWEQGRSGTIIRLYAAGNILVWTGIITAGRLIAYVY